MRRATRSSLLLAFLIAGCASTAGPGTFLATFPPDPAADVAATAVSLIDQTGLVTAMSPAMATTGVGGARAVPGDPNALLMEWPGDTCDGRISTVLTVAGGGYLLTVHAKPSLAGGLACTALTIARAMTVHLREPIAPDRVTIQQVYP